MEQLPDLNESQIACLELVEAGVTTSKAIAQRTGLSPSSIDNYLQRAAKSLGVSNRLLAAARYRELKALHNASVSRSVSRFSRVVRPIRIGIHGLAAGVRWLFSVPPIGGRRHQLNRVEIVFSILKVAAVSLAVFASFVLVGAIILWALR